MKVVRPHKFTLGLVGLLVIMAGVLVVGLQTGSFPLSTTELWEILTHPDHPNAVIVWDLRIPRLLLAFITGVILSIGGYFMQALIKNPLADPYIMGLTAGAGLGVNLVVLGIIPLGFLGIGLAYPTMAGVGGLFSLGLVLAMGWRSFYEDSARLLIAGVAVSAIFTAVTGILIYTMADSDQIRQLVFWSFGSFHRANWTAVHVTALLLVMALAYGLINARKLDLLLLGDVTAQSLGLRVFRSKFWILVVTSLTVGGTVAFTGPIGFVGMMIPHFGRSIWGHAHRPNLILGGLLGGTYLCACDVLSRWILPPAGLPIGIVTAILGVPFFLYLLFRRQASF